MNTKRKTWVRKVQEMCADQKELGFANGYTMGVVFPVVRDYIESKLLGVELVGKRLCVVEDVVLEGANSCWEVAHGTLNYFRVSNWSTLILMVVVSKAVKLVLASGSRKDAKRWNNCKFSCLRLIVGAWVIEYRDNSTRKSTVGALLSE